MFWGINLKPFDEVKLASMKPFHISNAALQSASTAHKGRPTRVFILQGKEKFLLCTLRVETFEHCGLDLNLEPTKNLRFWCQGLGRISLTGHYIEPYATRVGFWNKIPKRQLEIEDEAAEVKTIIVEEPDDDEPNEDAVANILNIKVESEEEVKQKANEVQLLMGGIEIEDIRIGNGPEVKEGCVAYVYYEGHMKSDNRIIISRKQGAQFVFSVGSGILFRGWDIGILGMKVNGIRRITCPPYYAFGLGGLPPIVPPNSTIIFEVELKDLEMP